MKKSAMEVLMEQEERRKQASLQAEEKAQRKDYWLHTGIVVKVLIHTSLVTLSHTPFVKVMNKKLGNGEYYKAKGEGSSRHSALTHSPCLQGVVRKVIDKYVGLVEMDDSGAKIQVRV